MEKCEAGENNESKVLAELIECKNIIVDLEAQGKLLLDERNKLKEDFGQQRARLKDLYIQKEDELLVNESKIEQLREKMNILESEKYHYRSLYEQMLKVRAKNTNISAFGEQISDKFGTAASDSSPLNVVPEALPLLTDDQKRALSGATVEMEPQEISSDSLFTSEKDVTLLPEEIANYQKLNNPDCKMCCQLESSLEKAEASLKENTKIKDNIEKAFERIKLDLEKESAFRKESETKWKRLSEDVERNVENIQQKAEEAAISHEEHLTATKRKFIVVREKLCDLVKERDVVNKEINRLQYENDCLMAKYSIRSQELQNEIINLPDSLEGMQLLLLKYREEVIAAKVAKEHIEDTLNSKVLLISGELADEQKERVAVERKLSLEIEHLRQKAENSAAFKERLLQERSCRIETEEMLKVAEQKARDSLTRSQHFITGLKNQIEEHENKQAQNENIVKDLKARVSSLQRDLKTSEAVQRDFVRLSQSLQVHLEKIRQSDKEVRWQHEDDIEDCNRCNQKFNTVGRRKYHCKHCGKIFCSDCVTKTVASGPSRRPSRVCDVCHTLLVHDAMPFFSTEAPR